MRLALAFGFCLFAVPVFADPPILACTVVAEVATGKVLHREGDCDTRLPPMSSFKLPLALMGFDSGILQDAHHPVFDLPKGMKPDAQAPDVRKADAAEWEKLSLVWFSRVLTQKLGMERFETYVHGFDYGNGDVSGDPGKGNGLTQAWLMSSLAISADEQVAFLRRFRLGQLPVSAHAVEMTETAIPEFQAGDWVVHGKTGTGYPLAGGEPDRAHPLGWFVGWADKDGREVVFARMEVAPARLGQPFGPLLRSRMLEDLPGMVD